MILRPRNWKEFQHYTDRRPAWVKLHRNLLDNIDFHRLPVASRALAPMLWLLASESEDGSFDASSETLAFRLRMSTKEVDIALNPLIKSKFFDVVQAASSALADDKQDACSEKRREETETEAQRKPLARPKRLKSPLPDDFIFSPNLREYTEKTLPEADPDAFFAKFCDQARAKAWEYADWVAAYQTYCRNAKPGSGHFAAGQYPKKSTTPFAHLRMS